MQFSTTPIWPVWSLSTPQASWVSCLSLSRWGLWSYHPFLVTKIYRLSYDFQCVIFNAKHKDFIFLTRDYDQEAPFESSPLNNSSCQHHLYFLFYCFSKSRHTPFEYLSDSVLSMSANPYLFGTLTEQIPFELHAILDHLFREPFFTLPASWSSMWRIAASTMFFFVRMRLLTVFSLGHTFIMLNSASTFSSISDFLSLLLLFTSSSISSSDVSSSPSFLAKGSPFVQSIRLCCRPLTEKWPFLIRMERIPRSFIADLPIISSHGGLLMTRIFNAWAILPILVRTLCVSPSLLSSTPPKFFFFLILLCIWIWSGWHNFSKSTFRAVPESNSTSV